MHGFSAGAAAALPFVPSISDADPGCAVGNPSRSGYLADANIEPAGTVQDQHSRARCSFSIQSGSEQPRRPTLASVPKQHCREDRAPRLDDTPSPILLLTLAVEQSTVADARPTRLTPATGRGRVLRMRDGSSRMGVRSPVELACLSVLAVLAYPAAAAAAGNVTVTFNTPEATTWTVPTGVTSATFDVRGAQGASNPNPASQFSGGNGADVQGTVSVTPGDVVDLTVAGQASGRTGGFGGGANGGAAQRASGFGGGGASSVALSGSTLLIAAGGGGASGNGGGGGDSGSPGTVINLPQGRGAPGGAGTQTGPGSGGAGGSAASICSSGPGIDGLPGADGALGAGGQGGDGPDEFSRAGGGGGGGYYGGGGGGSGAFCTTQRVFGAAGGGGGGGRHFDSSVTGQSLTEGAQSGNGAITVTFFDDVSPTASPTQTPAANANGWNNTDVTVDWNWSDDGAGVDTSNCTTQSISVGEGVI